ncbi:MAG TPA: hypothetical protein VFW24_01500 [Acidimicrobiales bacterium]|nr:hypothetical protein [Acidimicrobiales bacterium]
MGTSSREQREAIEAVKDPFARNTLRVAYHVRKYILLYVCGALGALALSLFPTLSGGGGPSGSGTLASGAGTPSGQAANGAVGAGATGNTTGAGSTTGLSASGGPVAAGASPAGQAAGATGGGSGGGTSSGGPVGQVQVGTGKTVSGATCTAGVHQLAWSKYSDMCVARFTGNNGGATYNGVTGNSIVIAVRVPSDAQGANSLEAQAENEAAGGASNDQIWGYTQKIVSYLNGQFELYGRHVVLKQFNGQGNYTNEELDTGQAPACADADTAASSVHAFGVLDYTTYGFETGVFSDCAARYHMYVPEGAGYFPEWWYKQHNPYVWGITMNCELIAQQTAEFVGKEIAPFPAKWAGNDGVTSMANTTRKFATYVPGNAEYQSCVQETLNIDESTYKIPKGREDQYNYNLDVSQFPQQAQQAIVQFAANHDTTVTLACDPISPIFLTQDAVNQNYYPEWLDIGVAQTDFDSWGQLWDAHAVSNHLYGVSQAASTVQILSPSSDAGQGLAKAGVPINISSATDYYSLLSMFNQLQAAGPGLSPAAIASATPDIPQGTGSFGTWHFGSTHTAIIDAREIWWNGGASSPADHKTGTFEELYGGKRFVLGQYPSGQPPFFQ